MGFNRRQSFMACFFGKAVLWRDQAKSFWIAPIGLYMLCLATGKTGKAKLLRSEMGQREVTISLLDRIDGKYKERKHETDR